VNIAEQVRAKNVDLLVGSYNQEVSRMNNEGFINPASKDVRKIKNKYENLLARFDTDKNCKHHKKGYIYKIPIDSNKIIGLSGIKPNINIEEK
jgi:hypothetical protein